MSPGIFRLQREGDPAKGLGPSSLVEPECFTTADKTELNHSVYESQDGKITVGVWECAPCREEIEAYPCDEMMTVLSGSVTLTGADGLAQTFGPGDTFFVAKGAKCVWEITETLRKFYMIASG